MGGRQIEENSIHTPTPDETLDFLLKDFYNSTVEEFETNHPDFEYEPGEVFTHYFVEENLSSVDFIEITSHGLLAIDSESGSGKAHNTLIKRVKKEWSRDGYLTPIKTNIRYSKRTLRGELDLLGSTPIDTFHYGEVKSGNTFCSTKYAMVQFLRAYHAHPEKEFRFILYTPTRIVLTKGSLMERMTSQIMENAPESKLGHMIDRAMNAKPF